MKRIIFTSLGLVSLITVFSLVALITIFSIGSTEVIADDGVSLTISKAVDIAEADPGDTITYTITYANTGTENASNVVITHWRT